jgi:putative tricarboxylic transport membrane protein
MARRGRAGAALAIAALGSFFAGIVATGILILFAPPLTKVALLFGPADYLSLMVLGLVTAVVLAHGSIVKALAMVVLGVLLGCIGTDVNTGLERMTFGIPELADGVGFVPLSMGLFAVAEIIRNLENPEDRSILDQKITGLWLTREEFRQAWPAVLRGTGVGSILGILPGSGAILASFSAYMVEKKLARDPSRFGRGAIEGVAGPESANNAAAQTSFIPLLTLGIPSNAVIALMAGAMTIQGIQPGPQVMTSRPDLFWGMIVSMIVGNAMLLIINLPLIRLWVQLLKIPYRMLYLGILAFCCIGTYTLNSSGFEVLLLIVFGFMGYVLAKLDCEPAPLLLAYILGPLMEEYLRRAMLLSGGDPSVFVESPISLGLLIFALVLVLLSLLPALRRRRDEALVE